MKEPEKISMTADEVNALLLRLENSDLSKDDRSLLSGVLKSTLWLQQMLSEAKLSIKRLHKIFSIKTEKK